MSAGRGREKSEGRAAAPATQVQSFYSKSASPSYTFANLGDLKLESAVPHPTSRTTASTETTSAFVPVGHLGIGHEGLYPLKLIKGPGMVVNAGLQNITSRTSASETCRVWSTNRGKDGAGYWAATAGHLGFPRKSRLFPIWVNRSGRWRSFFLG